MLIGGGIQGLASSRGSHSTSLASGAAGRISNGPANRRFAFRTSLRHDAQINVSPHSSSSRSLYQLHATASGREQGGQVEPSGAVLSPEELREQARSWQQRVAQQQQASSSSSREAGSAEGGSGGAETVVGNSGDMDSKRAARKAATAGLRRNLRNTQRAQQQQQQGQLDSEELQSGSTQQGDSRGMSDEGAGDEGDAVQASSRRVSGLNAGSSRGTSKGVARRLLFEDGFGEREQPEGGGGHLGGGVGSVQSRGSMQSRGSVQSRAGAGSEQSRGRGGRGSSGPSVARGAFEDQRWQERSEWGPPQRPLKEARVSLSRDLPVVRPGSGADSQGAFFSRRSDWNRLGLKADVMAALAELGVARPSHVQEAMLEAWSQKEALHFIVADQAGSGKTLAYLLPLVQAIRSEDTTMGKPNTQPRSPRAVILAPTTELVQQVYRVAKALSNAGARMRVAAMTGGQTDKKERDKSYRTQREALDGGVDMVICTPGRFTEHLAAGNVNLDAAKAVVLDEVDVLMGDTTSFADQIAPLRAVAPRTLRYVFVTATLPQQTAEELVAQWPDMAMVTGPGLHRTAAGLKEELVDCSGGDDISLESGTQRKLEALGQSLRKHTSARSLVFCNKIEACRDVENYLRRHFEGENMKVLVYHEAVRENLRHASMNAFLSAMPQDGSGERMVMVATDRMSRGIDSMYCGHVILFDFPRDPSEYVRRVGRTARGAGGTGVVTALVLGRQVALARDIIGGNEKGKPVHKLPQV